MLWPSSVVCLRSLVDIAPLLCVDPGRPVGAVVATDASSGGGGVVICSRYTKTELRHWAPLCYHKGRDDLGTEEYREAVGNHVKQHTFDTGFGWRWNNRGEHITVKEARAFWVGLQRVILHSKLPWNARHTFLEDNMGVVGAVTKGRSTNYKINLMIRRMCALQLVTGATIDMVWCPTLHQPADGESRSL